MRIGIVNPYSWSVPGGVQFHIRDLAEELAELLSTEPGNSPDRDSREGADVTNRH